MKFNDLIARKIKPSLAIKHIENMNFNKEELLEDKIYRFAGDIAQKAEYDFNLTSSQGDLVYNSIITALMYLKDYPRNATVAE